MNFKILGKLKAANIVDKEYAQVRKGVFNADIIYFHEKRTISILYGLDA